MAILPKEEIKSEAIRRVGRGVSQTRSNMEDIIDKIYDSVGKCKNCLYDNTLDCPLEWMYDESEAKIEKPEEYPDNYYCAEFKRRTDGS